MKSPAPDLQRGAALLTALLSVALIASLAATALWQQWRLTEVESQERHRQQALWILQGSLDWGRLILREDIRQAGNDHLGEPWAVPLKDARLSSFLAADKTVRDDALLSEAFLAGRIEDLQGRLNVRNLVDGRDVSPADLTTFERLFELLGLPPQEPLALALALRQALQPTDQSTPAPLLPQRVEQLVWLGLSEASLDRLRPFIAWLPERVRINLNTAPAEVLSASVQLPIGQARQLIAERERQPWRSLEEVRRVAGGRAVLTDKDHDVASRHFLISGQLRQSGHLLQAQALVKRDGLDVSVVWRELRALPPQDVAAGTPPAPR